MNPSPPHHAILFYDVVDRYVELRAPYRAEHLGLVAAAAERGEIVIAGALADPPDGAVLVFRGSTPEAARSVAEAFAHADPYVRNGLISRWHVRRWMTVVGDGAQFP